MYANGSGREGAVSKGSADANGGAGGAEEMAGTECGVLDGSGVVAKVARPSEEGEKVDN
jgi:hypothetical protein